MDDRVPGEFQVGALIAGYRLEERIGQGGMAVVFRAHDSRLDRPVALKILAPALAEDAAFRQRFIRESRAAAAVDDAHIIPVYEAGEAAGVLFIAMRYVRGGDVRSLLDRIGRVPPERTAEIVAQVAAALDAAHARGLVHRDVKPGNMLLEESPAAGRPEHVYLSDFGLSKAALAAGSDLTATGQFLGTLDYVAPEQIESRPLDGRSDEYALACSAFELLCGEPPFGRGQGVSALYAHLSQPPPRISTRLPSVPAAVDDVLTRGMAKAPGDRYATCREFAAAFHQALTGPGARPPREHPHTQIAAPPRTAPPDTAPADLAPADLAPAGTALPDAARPPAAGVASAEVAAATQAANRPAAGGTRGPGGTRSRDVAGDAEETASPPGGQGAEPRSGTDRRRPWWRSPVPVAVLAFIVAAAAVGGFLLSGGNGPSGGDSGHSKGGSPLTAVPGTRLPACTTAVAKAKDLTDVATATTTVPGGPFGVAVTPDNRYTFVATGNAVEVLRNSPGRAPAVLRRIPAHGADKGVEITPDGRFAVAAAGSGAVVISVQAAVDHAADPVAGSLTSPGGSGAVEVLITGNGKFAFVTLQGSAEMAVFNLQAALTRGFGPADFIGDVPLADQPVGMVSDGTWLYVVSLAGTLAVVNVHKAESDQAHAVDVTTKAGCGSARVLLADGDKIVWVTARQSDALLAFDAARLRTDPGHALLASVRVGEYPLGEALVNNGSAIVVADSDLNDAPGSVANLAVVSTARALAGKPAVVGYLRAGPVPRQFAVEPGGKTLLVTVQDAHQLVAVDLGGLP